MRKPGPRSLFAVSLVLALLAIVVTYSGRVSAAPKTFDPHCNGKQAEKRPECQPDATEVVVIDVEVTEGDSLGSNDGAGDTNPDCNTHGPERSCGEEDGDHNQGGPCDGNEGNRDDDCSSPSPTSTPQPTPTPDPSATPTAEPVPAIELEKSGPVQVGVGDAFEYTLTITNAGASELGSVSAEDALLGLDIDLPDLAAGESAVVTISSLAPLIPASVVNTAEACGTAAGISTCDVDDHTVLVIDPGIALTKTASPDSVNPGQTVTFTYVVTNSGTGDLAGVTVTDDVLGDVGSADLLAAGDALTFTQDFLVADDSPTTNIATACGTDALGVERCDVAVEDISIVLPAGPQTRDGGSLPTTGIALLVWIASAVTSLAGGLAMIDVRRRRRTL